MLVMPYPFGYCGDFKKHVFQFALIWVFDLGPSKQEYSQNITANPIQCDYGDTIDITFRVTSVE